MFAAMRAKRPYAEHQAYQLIAGRIELVTDHPIAPELQAAVDRDYAFRTLHRETDRAALRARTTAMLTELGRRYPALALRGVRVYVTMFELPAYPAPARLIPHDLGILGELVDGTWTDHVVALPASGRVSLAGDPALTGAPLAIYREGLPVAGPPPAADAAGILQVPPGRDMLHLVARLPGHDGVVRPYVVARRTTAYW